MGAEVAVQRHLGQRQGLVGGRQRLMQVLVRAPGLFVRGQQPADRGRVVAVDEQPQQCLAHVGGRRIDGQPLFVVLPRLCEPPGVVVVAAHQAQELPRAAHSGQGMARGVGGGVELIQGVREFVPLVAAGVQGQGLDQVARLIVLLPGQQCHLGGLQGLVLLQQADECVVVRDVGMLRVHQFAVGGNGELVARPAPGQVAREAPQLGGRFGRRRGAVLHGLQPLQAQFGLAVLQGQHGGMHGALGGDLCRVGQQLPPGLQGQIGLACAFGQLRQQLQRLGALRVLAQVVDGGLGFAQAFLRIDQGAHQARVAGAAAQLVAQRLHQRGIVELARRQPQHGLPGGVLVRLARQGEPVLQRDAGALRPLRHLCQALAPAHVGGVLAHRGVGDGPGVLELAVFQEHLVAQGVGLVVEGQGGRRPGGGLVRHLLREAQGRMHEQVGAIVEHRPRQRGRRLRAPGDGPQREVLLGAGPLGGLPFERHAQQAAHVVLGHVGAACGACQLREHEQGLRVVGQGAQLALGQLQGGRGLVARPQCGNGRAVVRLGLGWVGGAVARGQVELRAALVVAARQRFPGFALVVQGGLARVLRGFPATECQGDLLLAELTGQGCQPILPLLGPAFLRQLAYVPPQPIEQREPPVRLAVRDMPVLGVEQVPLRPQRFLAQCGVGRVQGGLQRRARAGGVAMGDLALREQQAQARVVGVAAQQVVQVGGGQLGLAARRQALLQVLARV